MPFCGLSTLGFFLFKNLQHTSCILVCCTLRHFLFLVHIEFLSCFGFIRFSNRKKSAGLLCIWKYNRWFIFEYVFVKFIHIVYFVYSYMYLYIIYTTLSMLNLQVNKSEIYTKVNYFSRFIRFKCHYHNRCMDYFDLLKIIF